MPSLAIPWTMAQASNAIWRRSPEDTVVWACQMLALAINSGSPPAFLFLEEKP